MGVLRILGEVLVSDQLQMPETSPATFHFHACPVILPLHLLCYHCHLRWWPNLWVSSATRTSEVLSPNQPLFLSSLLHALSSTASKLSHALPKLVWVTGFPTPRISSLPHPRLWIHTSALPQWLTLHSSVARWPAGSNQRAPWVGKKSMTLRGG